ncbi:MAG TPA: lysylphosphatidylglycerol synthase domain-containing protein [Burkholderiaceae bacterium]|jgi:uncharacterized membrane protein YbhN (UPF0104 family)|nr:lysylphosphatidylglycerol synthase domain-containing protein [Burkholderiaceae bacterium]
MKLEFGKLKPLLWVAVIAFIAGYLVRNGREILSYGYQFDWPFIPMSLAFVLLAYLLNIAIWIGIASHYGAHASWLSHARIWSVSRLGRYVPGKVATIYLRVDGYESGHRGKAGVALYIETASSLISVCAFILVFSALGFVELQPLHIALIAVALGGLLLLSSGPFLRKFFGHFKSLQSLSPPRTRADGMLLAKAVGLQTIVMTLHGVSLFLAILAFTAISPVLVIEITVFYYFAGLMGMLALFAPAGIGVREAVLVGLLQTLIPLPIAVVAVALTRLLTVVAELALSGIFVLLSPARLASPDKE